jgi:hypothetical protein
MLRPAGEVRSEHLEGLEVESPTGKPPDKIRLGRDP